MWGVIFCQTLAFCRQRGVFRSRFVAQRFEAGQNHFALRHFDLATVHSHCAAWQTAFAEGQFRLKSAEIAFATLPSAFAPVPVLSPSRLFLFFATQCYAKRELAAAKAKKLRRMRNAVAPIEKSVLPRRNAPPPSGNGRRRT